MGLERDRNFWQSTFLFGVFIAFSLILGSVGATAFDTTSNSETLILAQANSTTDQYQTAKQLYLQNCASCHIPIPPEVLPTATWKQILEYPQQHYGQSLNLINSVEIVAMWQYIRDYSRPLLEGETPPKFITNSRYFKALHPGVDLPSPITHQTCIGCHPGAAQLDYRTLRQE